MGRAKIEIKKIEDATKRQCTFSKRRGGLMRKAEELAILCDAEVAVVVFSCNGKLYQFSSKSNVQETFSRYLEEGESSEAGDAKTKQYQQQEDVLNAKIAELQTRQRRLSGQDLSGLSRQELLQLENELKEGLQSVTEQKEQLLMDELEDLRSKEERALQEVEHLRKMVDAYQGSLPPPTPSEQNTLSSINHSQNQWFH